MRNHTVAITLFWICTAALGAPEIVPLQISVECVHNPKCSYEGGNMLLELTVTNGNPKDIVLPVEYLARRGPFIRLTDVRSQQRVSVGTGIPDYALRSSMRTLAPGESFRFHWTISKYEIEQLDGRPVHATADVALIDMDGVVSADKVKKFVGRTSFEIAQPIGVR